jgi:UDP-N-acetylglucosamine 2-epimerase
MHSKIDFVITARPSWSRVKSIIENYANLNGSNSIRILLVGSAVSNRFGNIESQMPAEIRTEIFPTLREGDDFTNITLSVLDGASALARFWGNSRPDSVFVVADRVETLGVSLSAAAMQIPLIHLQGGEVSGSIDDKIRDTNTKLADLHLTTNEFTKENLLKIGESTDNIKVIGCPSIDILSERISLRKKLFIYSELYGGVGSNFSTALPYGVILFHPDTHSESASEAWPQAILETALAANLNWFWFWPNPDHGSEIISKIIRKYRESTDIKNIRFLKNLPPEVFMDLTLNASVLVGNSSYGIREASFIGLPVINLGNRQRGRDRFENTLDLITVKNFESELRKWSDMKFSKSTLYGDGMAGKYAAKILLEWKPFLKIRKI